uniref:hypothetical protein n=1 Tax=Chamaesiphon sp. OTE_75_metabat_556 TaxID=2964692 RepID=UPI00286D3550
QCGLGACDDGESAVADAGFALILEVTGDAFQFIEPDTQTMLLRQRASEVDQCFRVPPRATVQAANGNRLEQTFERGTAELEKWGTHRKSGKKAAP